MRLHYWTACPQAKWLLGDRGYDADWFREALQAKEHALHPQTEIPDYASVTTRTGTKAETELRSCSGGSRTGGASAPATIGA